MPMIPSSNTPVFDLPFLSVTGLAAPRHGARETCVWRLTLAPGAPGTPHSVDREEIFVALEGQARMSTGGRDMIVRPGDTLIVPAGEQFSHSNPGSVPFVAMAVLPVGGKAVLPGGESFSPPWTE